MNKRVWEQAEQYRAEADMERHRVRRLTVPIVSVGAAWPGGISSGLTLPCALCGRSVVWDYHIPDGMWQSVVPQQHRRGVICLECLANLPGVTGAMLAGALEFVQFTGMSGLTVVFRAAAAYVYGDCPAGASNAEAEP